MGEHHLVVDARLLQTVALERTARDSGPRNNSFSFKPVYVINIHI